YLNFKNYKIEKYVGYDILLNTPFTKENFNEFYLDYNFIKMDCEGCEYEVFKDIPIEKLRELFDGKYVAIALHKGGMFDKTFNEDVYKNITSILPHKIFLTGNKDMSQIEEIWVRNPHTY
ncbi:MAG: hypothetical protein ACP5OE_09935, partial [Thermodesulfobium sp.]